MFLNDFDSNSQLQHGEISDSISPHNGYETTVRLNSPVEKLRPLLMFTAKRRTIFPDSHVPLWNYVQSPRANRGTHYTRNPPTNQEAES
ncbi:hypothetical protein N7523_008605 [Penicillium sp. IBT 18751x]|nr:hypothetical protein N7523_008605 [Penicillium sp. IBT 18751x]